MTGQEGTAHTPSPSPLQPPHLRKATQDDSIGRDPIFHLMFNQSFDWGVGRARLGGGSCWGLKGSKQALPSASGRESGEGMQSGGWSLTVLCCLLDTNFVLWGIWTQPHQVKPGQAEAAVFGRAGQPLQQPQLPSLSCSTLTRTASPSSC